VEANTCTTLAGLKEIFHKYPGSAKVRLRLVYDDLECLTSLSEELCVGPCPQFWQAVDDCLANAGKATV